MTHSDLIALDALSAEQRRLVETHLPLAHRVARRLLRRGRPDRDYRDLYQEGALALAEALRSHDAARHGPFPAYALSRVHFAVSRFAQENDSCIRVPFIALRRRRAAERNDPETRRPDAALRVVRMDDRRFPDARADDDRRNPDEPVHRNAGEENVPNVILPAVVAEVIAEMRASPRGGDDYERVVTRCAEERWTIPDRDSRRSLRALARDLHCSVGRIARCEKTFRTKVARRLRRVHPSTATGRSG